MILVEGVATVDDVDAFVSDLAAFGEEYGCTVQAFDARYVVGRDHLERALELADRAIDRGENVARDRGVEVLLYAAGRRQIDRSLRMGVGEGTSPVVVLVAALPGAGGSAEATGERDEIGCAAAVRERLDSADTLGVNRADPDLVRDFFDIGAAELAATDATLADLVLERVALLDVEK